MDSIQLWLIVLISVFMLRSAETIQTRTQQGQKSTETTRVDKIESPKVIWIENENIPTNFNNYSYNQTFPLNSNKLKLRCEPIYRNQTTRWLWKVSDDVGSDQRIVTQVFKERTKEGIISELTVKFVDTEDVRTHTNFSCSRVTTKGYRPNELVTCIILSGNLKTKNTTVLIREDVQMKDCHLNNNGYTTKCKGKLILDLEEGRGTCQNKNDTIKTTPCKDIDSCKALIETEGQINSTKHCGSVMLWKEYLSKNKSLTLTQFRPETLKVVYCQEDFFEWTASFFSYPTFSSTSWSKFKYYESFNDAMKSGKTIFLYAIRPDESFMASNIKSINSIEVRTEFAKGETVEFVCIGVQYLYMKGFEFYLGGSGWSIALSKPYNISKNATTYELDSERHITRINVTLGPDEHNRYPNWISCKGPIWNSLEWKEEVLKFNLSDPQSPKVSLTKVASDVKGFEKLNCSYEGWPRPAITWGAMSELVLFGNLSSHTKSSNSERSWYQVRYVKDNESYKVNCTAKNFVGYRTSEPLSGGWGKIVLIILGTASGVIAFSVILFALLYWKHRKKLEQYSRQDRLTSEDINAFYSGGRTDGGIDCEALLLPYNSEYEISRNQFNLDGAVLGSGQFGLVLKGNIGPITVAVKTIKPTAGAIHLRALLSELKILQFVGSHRNIVNLIGANTENLKKREVYLIMDFCSNGSLVNLLRHCRENFVDFFGSCTGKIENVYEKQPGPIYQNSRDITLTTGHLIHFACEIASAMDHLASKNVIHGDLAARNVLITDDLHAKICDFGLAKQLRHYSIYVQRMECPLPLRWMAIESLADMEFSLASDKWSYGIVLYEIFSLGELPYPGVQWGFESYKLLQEGYRMSMPTYSNHSIYKLMLQCWSSSPQERPSFQHIIRQLKKEEVGLM